LNPAERWGRYRRHFCAADSAGLTIDISRIPFDDQFFERTAPAMERAYDAMEEIERGGIANPDEKRMVGHYWLRAPSLAPSKAIADEIRGTICEVMSFATEVHEGRIRPPGAPRFTRLLSIGIGGSALGPMFVADALGHPSRDKMRIHFMDNTDPDGIERTLSELGGRLSETLCIVTSKSGTTPETRNGMRIAAAAYGAAGLEFARHAVAVTMRRSTLDDQAVSDGWIARFPMFDWIGGRTSVLSAAGLLPAALQGIDIEAMLAGAASCDEATRVRDTARNPAALLALMWLHATEGKGRRDMVILPYKDRLLLLGRYLQQLVMESLGKRLDLDGRRVDQGISVYGNKGSTDQHAYVQQLRDGVDNFFVVFVRVLESGGDALEVEPGVTAGDYLHGFLLGPREALTGNDRQAVTVTIRRVDGRAVGALIALFERAVGFYASLVNINAYNQPGVEAGKKAASSILALQRKVEAVLTKEPRTAEQVARGIGPDVSVETVYLLLEHLAANGRAAVAAAGGPGEARFRRA